MALMLWQAYVDKYLKGVDEFLHKSDLETRVRDWQSKVEPKLQEEDRRPPFDIHVRRRLSGGGRADKRQSYGETVKGRVAREVKAVEEMVPFENIVSQRAVKRGGDLD
eukprot:758402-Hanusia_phi.AAC.1